MFDQAISGAVASLIYAVLGYLKNKSGEEGASFNIKKSSVTVALSCVVGVVMFLTELSTGNFLADGALAVGLGSYLKKAGQIALELYNVQ